MEQFLIPLNPIGCAINCSQKQEYITQIIESEESLQRDIMKAIQELENIWQGTSASRTSLSLPTFDAKILQDERDILAQKCHEAEVSVQKIYVFPHRKIDRNKSLIFSNKLLYYWTRNSHYNKSSTRCSEH